MPSIFPPISTPAAPRIGVYPVRMGGQGVEMGEQKRWYQINLGTVCALLLAGVIVLLAFLGQFSISSESVVITTDLEKTKPPEYIPKPKPPEYPSGSETSQTKPMSDESKPSRLKSIPLEIIHTPNPTDQNKSEFFKDPPHEHMWFYRTVVRNKSERKLKVVWFEAYFKHGKDWYASNILGKPLTNAVFSQWFSDGAEGLDSEGWIIPKGEALNAGNWHYNVTRKAPDFKWCFIAVDEYGHDYSRRRLYDQLIRSKSPPFRVPCRRDFHPFPRQPTLVCMG